MSRKTSIITERWLVGEWREKKSQSLVGKWRVEGKQAGRQRSSWSVDISHHRDDLLSAAFQIPLMIGRPRCQLLLPQPRFNQPDLRLYFMRSHLSSGTKPHEGGGRKTCCFEDPEQERAPLLGDKHSIDKHVQTSHTRALAVMYPN